ncbi:hypothetical protein [Cellulomonas fengjieae]|uniref:hypothetical protein n=1 Tax=Cellulomonas fengjieae TaxID=2819978 RepID=UPI001AAF0C1D|nr:hypothetical protein [Cellulomonas fengjieae]MBO3103494.1 hypothetical protein [Cellulomonas fengjieae]
MLRLLQLDELEGLLLEAADVLDRFHARDPGFETLVDGWLVRVEEALRNNRLPLSSRVATTRAELTAARSSRRGRDGAPATRVRRSDRQARAVAAVKRVVEELDAELSGPRRRFGDADDVARNVLAVGSATGVLGPSAGGGSSLEALRALRDDPRTAGGVVQLHGLVGHQDSVMVVGRRLVDLVP